MKLKDTFFLCLILWKEKLIVSSRSDYYDGLLKYLKKDPRLHQIVYLLDDKLNHPDPLMDSLMSAVNSHFPSFTVNHSEIQSAPFTERLEILLRPKITGLFVLQWSENTTFDKFEEFFTDKNDLLKGPAKPKCLIVLSYPLLHTNISRITPLFELYNYMDFSVLINTNERTLKIEQNINKLILIVKNALYIAEFNSAKLSPKSQWFPKHFLSTNNSHMFEYLVVINFFQILMAENYIGLETLPSALLNSKMVFNKEEDLSACLAHFQMEKKDVYSDQVISERVQPFMDDEEGVFIKILFLTLDPVRAVIPKMSKHSKVINVSTEFWYMIIVTICTISIIRLVAFLMKFNKSTWQTLNMSQIIMGMPLNHEPRNLAERAVFGSLIITCIVFTGYFYSIILDISFRPSPEMSTLTELLKSNLKPFMPADVFLSLVIANETTNNEKILSIGKQFAVRGHAEFMSEEDCLLKYIDYRNVSCIIENSPHHVRNYMAKSGKTDLKILEETVLYTYNSFDTESFTPYLDVFIQRALNVLEFGLSKEVYRTNVNLRQTNKLELQMISKEQIFVALFYVGIIGYSLAIMAFIVEVITAKIMSKFFHKPKFPFVN